MVAGVNEQLTSSSIITSSRRDEEQEEESFPIVAKCHSRLQHYSKWVLTFWGLAFLIGGYFSSYFINKAEDRLEAPFHSRAGK
jgi:hypothetical protein